MRLFLNPQHLLTDRQIANSVAGYLRRFQIPAPGTESIVGLQGEESAYLHLFLDLSEDGVVGGSRYKPIARLSDWEQEAWK